MIKSGMLAYLTITGEDQEPRFMCLSRILAGGKNPSFAEARLCTSEDFVMPVIVRARPLRDRRQTLADGEAINAEMSFLSIESTQALPNQGQTLVLAVGTDWNVSLQMKEQGFPQPSETSAASLVSSQVPMQSPLFIASASAPELSSFLITGIKGQLHFGEAFNLLTHFGYLSQNYPNYEKLSMQLFEPSKSWKLLPYATLYSAFSPDGCLAHSPAPVSLLDLHCPRKEGELCQVLGRKLYFSRHQCEAQVAGEEEPKPAKNISFWK
jgi:hypothetical protein